jgi:hypothetical protein
MNLHPVLRLCTHLGVAPCCTSYALQPAAVVQHPCSKSFLISRHPLHPPSKPMQGKIKGGGTTVRAKTCLHRGGRGTRPEWRCAVRVAGRWRERVAHLIVVMAVNARLEYAP